MINYMRMSKLKVDVSYSQSKFEQSRLTTSIPILLGSMQSLVLAVFGALAIFLRKLPCVKSSIRKTKRLHSSLKTQEAKYMVGASGDTEALGQRVKQLEQLVNDLTRQLRNLQQGQPQSQ